VESTFAGGEKARILDGVCAHFTGFVAGVDSGRRTLNGMLTFLSRELTIELRFAQVRKAA
jgi:transcription antitermination factor NusG